ncbi:MAG: hypothetical protein Q4A75_04640 [Peptostreptococcaceae bacterium]|nr:hypothetical protein [Peptostreptococcaceae bacterium]
MTRSRNNILLWLGFAVAQLPLVGAYLLWYFTRKKLGMLRYMVYLNAKWEARFPVGMLKLAAVALLVALALYQIASYRKRGRSILPVVIAVPLTLYAAGSILMTDTQWSRAYYPISICLVLYGIAINLWSISFARNRKTV